FRSVQAVTGWELFARRLCDSGYKVFVTGSNSLMLGREIATQLRGRNAVVEVLPLSFSEFLLFRGVAIGDKWEYDKQKNAIRKLFDEYFRLSGFPEVVLEGDLGILDEYFKTMFYRDVVERYRIRNSGLVRFLMNYLSRNYSCEFSIYKFNNVAKSNGYVSSTSVVQKYAEILSNTYFCMYATPLQKSPAKEAAYGRKAYLIDHGLANYFNVDKDPGRLMENLVCIELARRKKSLHYLRQKGECDFVTDDECIQVTYALTDDNKAREVDGLVEAAKRLKPKKRTILTYDQESEITSEGLKIRVVPLWKWLLHSPDKTI
ncbi:MAG: ATP-binding protein, partial [Candidatus Micrarchaeia archaeon]